MKLTKSEDDIEAEKEKSAYDEGKSILRATSIILGLLSAAIAALEFK